MSAATTKPSVLLTGGTGFVGSRLARRLLDEGFAVTVLAQLASRLDQLARVGAADDVTVVRCASAQQDLPGILLQTRPDLVIHVASVSRGGETPAELARMIEANVTFPTLLLAAMRAAGVRRFVNTGTSWQTCEGDGYSPFNVYAGTKQAAEDLLACFCVGGMAAVTLRLFDTYGPHDERRKIVDLIADAAQRGTPLAMSPGEQVIDLVHVDDVAAAFLVAARLLLDDKVQGHAVYGVSGTRVTLRELAEQIGEAMRRAPPIEWGGRPYRPREVMQPWSGFEHLPGWAPRIGLDAGLREVVAARSHQEESASA
jgi:nucleoside-diphosphate-sugar epimerase